jgi:D-alanyl-D-alanine dipeptidase
MDEGYAFMLKITDFPVAENGEPLVSLREAADNAGAEVAFSDTPLSEGLARKFFLRKGLIPSFTAAALALNRQGLVLKVEDAYRDRPMQKSLALKPSLLQKIGPRLLWECGGKLPDSGFIGRRLAALIAHCPKTGTHMSGSALDISVLLRAGRSELDRGAPYLEMSELTPMDSPFVSAEARKNRQHITSLMREHGFVEYPFEFWHYSSGDAIAMLVANKPGPAHYGAVELAPDGRTSPLANPLESLNSLESLAAALKTVVEKAANQK